MEEYGEESYDTIYRRLVCTVLPSSNLVIPESLCVHVYCLAQTARTKLNPSKTLHKLGVSEGIARAVAVGIHQPGILAFWAETLVHLELSFDAKDAFRNSFLRALLSIVILQYVQYYMMESTSSLNSSSVLPCGTCSYGKRLAPQADYVTLLTIADEGCRSIAV